MKRSPFPLRVILSASALLALAAPASAQEPRLEDYRDRLPEATIACISWQNLSELEALRTTNPVLRLLASPEMKANWKALEDYQREVEKRKSAGEKAAPSPARPATDFGDIAQLMTNPGFLALVAPPTADGSARPREPEVVFLYDAEGKEELIARLDEESRKPGEKRSTYEFEGATVEETRSAEGKPVSYRARVGRWLVRGSEKDSFEAWLRAMKEAPAHSLRDSAAYQQAQGLWSPWSQVRGFLDASLLMETLSGLPPSKPNEPTAAQVLEALDLHRWEVLTFDATLDATTLRYQVTGRQGGDRDGLLGVLGVPVPEFPSVRLAPPNSFAYSTAQVDLLATWNYLLSGVDALAPRQQAGMIQGVLAMAEGLLGIPVEELMSAWGREYAQFSFVDSGGASRSVYVLSLRNREQVLAALRHLAEKNVIFLPIEEVPPDEGGGDAVYFHLLSAPGENDAPPKPSFYFAVAGSWLLVGERKEDLEAALGRAGGRNPSLGQSPAFQQARSRFPAALSGFSYLDAERWLGTDAAQELFRTILESATRRSSEAEKEPEAEPKPEPEGESTAEPPAEAAPEDEPPQAEEPPVPFPELQIPRGYLKWLLSATTRHAHSFRVVGIIE